jgi:tRNA G10  N-methylase Trm11
MTSSYVFLLGRTPLLAFAELAALYPQAQWSEVAPSVVMGNLDLADPTQEILRLGGTVKIGIPLGELPVCTPDDISQYILNNITDSSFTFGISTVGSVQIGKSFLSDVKDLLETAGKHVRFVEGKHDALLSSAVILGQRVNEFIVVKKNETYYVYKSVAVQHIDEWSKRDYDRPHADAKRGMLPPKVARMVMNIALDDHQKGKKVLDPFCGMGTILAEAYVSGIESFGCDLDPEVIDLAKENMSWLKKAYPAVAIPPKCQVADAVHVSALFDPESIDAIVTEPFLGAPTIATKAHIEPQEIKNTVKGLEKLYIGCLKDWYKILKPRGYVVIALPAFAIEGHKYFVKKVVDSCENFGYSIKQGPLEYSRPQAVVSRNFYIFQKN